MKIFAFDNKVQLKDSEWSKRWESLGQIDVHKCNSVESRGKAVVLIKTTCETGAAILLVHLDKCECLVHDNVTSLLESCPRLFVMYVRGGPQSKNDSPAMPRVHYSRRVVLTGSDLGHLKGLFSKICATLANAGTDTDKIRRAWEEWESPVLSRLIATIAPLALEPKNETLANFVANSIRKDLRHASDELGKKEGELALCKLLLNAEETGTSLLEWIQRYPQTLCDLAQRYL